MNYKSMELLNKYKNYNEIHKVLIEKYYDRLQKAKKIMIFGTKQMARSVKQYCEKINLSVIGFIDNNKELHGRYIEGIKVYSINDVQSDSLVIIATLNYIGVIEKQLKDNKIFNYINYVALSECDKENFPIYNYCYKDYLKDLFENKDKYINLFNQIKDEKSLQVLDNVLLFRLTFEGEYLSKAYEISISDNGSEYFDNAIVKFNDEETFVDGGAYFGETTIQFVDKVKNKYKKIYIFEPDDEIMFKCKNNLKTYHDIEYLNYGLGEKRNKMLFMETKDTGGHISDKGKKIINICSIDDLNNNEISFIKLDIEGAEKAALIGAKNTIIRNKPKLAISAYHNANDLWQLYLLVKEFNPNYDVYIRHYSNGIFETDFYFIER